MKLVKSLDELPSVIADNKFNDYGLAETEEGLLVPAYVASGLIFNVPGRQFLNHHFYPLLKKEAKILPLCPFQACGEYLGPPPGSDATGSEIDEYWKMFNEHIIPKVNYKTLIPRSFFIFAIFDPHPEDPGVAAEVTFANSIDKTVIGIKTDFRKGENPSAIINPAVREFIDGKYLGNGQFFYGNDAYECAIDYAKQITSNTLAQIIGSKKD